MKSVDWKEDIYDKRDIYPFFIGPRSTVEAPVFEYLNIKFSHDSKDETHVIKVYAPPAREEKTERVGLSAEERADLDSLRRALQYGRHGSSSTDTDEELAINDKGRPDSPSTESASEIQNEPGVDHSSDVNNEVSYEYLPEEFRNLATIHNSPCDALVQNFMKGVELLDYIDCDELFDYSGNQGPSNVHHLDCIDNNVPYAFGATGDDNLFDITESMKSDDVLKVILNGSTSPSTLSPGSSHAYPYNSASLCYNTASQESTVPSSYKLPNYESSLAPLEVNVRSDNGVESPETDVTRSSVKDFSTTYQPDGLLEHTSIKEENLCWESTSFGLTDIVNVVQTEDQMHYDSIPNELMTEEKYFVYDSSFPVECELKTEESKELVSSFQGTVAGLNSQSTRKKKKGRTKKSKKSDSNETDSEYYHHINSVNYMTNGNILQCVYCSKIFQNNEEFADHIVRHCTFPKKNLTYFSCDICAVEFTELSKLLSHLKSHTKDKDFPCKSCKRNFSYSCFVSHQRKSMNLEF